MSIVLLLWLHLLCKKRPNKVAGRVTERRVSVSGSETEREREKGDWGRDKEGKLAATSKMKNLQHLP